MSNRNLNGMIGNNNLLRKTIEEAGSRIFQKELREALELIRENKVIIDLFRHLKSKGLKDIYLISDSDDHACFFQLRNGSLVIPSPVIYEYLEKKRKEEIKEALFKKLVGFYEKNENLMKEVVQSFENDI